MALQCAQVPLVEAVAVAPPELDQDGRRLERAGVFALEQGHHVGFPDAVERVLPRPPVPGFFVWDGSGPVFQVCALLALMSATAAAASIVFPSAIFSLNS